MALHIRSIPANSAQPVEVPGLAYFSTLAADLPVRTPPLRGTLPGNPLIEALEAHFGYYVAQD
ncbi:hypothetical protein [Tabrizicola oligotrophica]|uniref:Uncharacterized protein n=1 Tax=Tabrizicola oligotrophica TaxID=2710650 RepID=A0A6M0QS66_9RHOB|nr:hypothetical protein [Tabrizicola oligotrophica]NEY89831.1 hypothetical protein [Tabrizicola oligotrophica]